jgi:FdhE protein
MPDTSVDLLARADERWRHLAEDRPELDRAIRLQRTLVTRVDDLVRALDDWRGPVTSPSTAAVRLRLSDGRPFQQGERVAVPCSLLRPALLDFCGDLADGGAGDAARHVRAVLESGRIDAASLLVASLQRNQRAIRERALHEGLAPDLLWLVAELAAGPVAYLLQRQVIDALAAAGAHRELQEAWDRGYCPACGSWPAFAERLDPRGPAWLRCSFCGVAWRLRNDRCIYCGEAGAAFVLSAPDLEASRRVQLCGTCQYYLKSIDVAEATPFQLLPVEDLVSNDLDFAAMERGYGRPSLPEFGELTDRPCERR